MPTQASFLGRVYRYRQSETKGNAENYFTRILVELINRMDIECRRKFINRIVTSGDCFGDPEGIVSRILNSKKLLASDQFRDKYGKIPDIAIFDEIGHFIFIEIKLTAKLSNAQLLNYDRSLSETAVGSSALIFLTKITPFPEDFLTRDGAYNVSFRSVLNWIHIAGIIGSLSMEAVSPDFVVFALDFLRLMEENGMNGRIGTLHDMETVSAASASIEHVLNIIRMSSPYFYGYFENIGEKEDPYYSDGFFWHYSKLPNIQKNLWAGFGIRIPLNGASQHDSLFESIRHLKESPALFCALACYDKLPSEKYTEARKIAETHGWAMDDFGFVIAQHISDLPNAENDIVDATQKFLKIRAPQLKDIFLAIKK